VDCTARQVAELHQSVAFYAEGLERPFAAMRAGDLISRLLSMPSDQQRAAGEADDRSAGYPLRRIAEFGILPRYEFPTEPASLRLLGDAHEEDPVTVTRRFGIGQFQPEANVYARSRRWKVIGLDTASSWNPRSEGPTWLRSRIRPVTGHPLTSRSERGPRRRPDRLGQRRPGVFFGRPTPRIPAARITPDPGVASSRAVQVRAAWRYPA
jgi:hypothetical protein